MSFFFLFWQQFSHTLQLPVIKFICHAMSFLTFLVLIVLVTVESSVSVTKELTLKKQYPSEYANYKKMYTKAFIDQNNQSSDVLAREDFPLRANTPTTTEIMMSLWIVGELDVTLLCSVTSVDRVCEWNSFILRACVEWANCEYVRNSRSLHALCRRIVGKCRMLFCASHYMFVL